MAGLEHTLGSYGGFHRVDWALEVQEPNKIVRNFFFVYEHFSRVRIHWISNWISLDFQNGLRLKIGKEPLVKTISK